MAYSDGFNGHHGGNGNGGAPEPDRPRAVTVHWENLASLRYWGGAIFGGFMFVVAVTFLSELLSWTLPDWLVQALFIGFVIIALAGGLVGRRYWCPWCRGMVRAGATVCPHCGRDFDV